MRYLYGHPTARPVTVGPGDFDPPDDECDVDRTERIYRLDRVVQRQGAVVVIRTAVDVDPTTHEVVQYAYHCRSVVRWDSESAEAGGYRFQQAVRWCRKQAKKRGGRMPRVWARLVELAASHGKELKP